MRKNSLRKIACKNQEVTGRLSLLNQLHAGQAAFGVSGSKIGAATSG